MVGGKYLSTKNHTAIVFLHNEFYFTVFHWFLWYCIIFYLPHVAANPPHPFLSIPHYLEESVRQIVHISKCYDISLNQELLNALCEM